jgi:hypothetical protein
MRVAACSPWLVVIALVLPQYASAQSALPLPRLEVGAEVSMGTVVGGEGTTVAGPRLTVNLSPAWSVDFTGDRYHRQRFSDYTERNFIGQLRLRVWETGIAHVSLLVGAGGSEERFDFGTETHRFRQPLILAGAGLGLRLGRHAAVHTEIKFLPVNRAGGGARLSTGISVPVGQYPPPARNVVLPNGERVRIGERAWVTVTGGDVVAGVVSAVSPSTLVVNVRGASDERAIAFGDVRRIEVEAVTRRLTTRVGRIGAIVGAAAGVLQAVWWVNGNGGEGVFAFAIWVPGLSGLGTIAGAMLGSAVDRRVVTRRTVFDLSAVPGRIAAQTLATREK